MSAPTVTCCGKAIEAARFEHADGVVRHQWKCSRCRLDVALREPGSLDTVMSKVRAKAPDLDPVPLFVLAAGAAS